MAHPIQTTWMWHDEDSGGVLAAIIDLEAQCIQWLDQPGCACGDSASEQSIADFLRQGPRWLQPPADVEAEMRAALAQAAGVL
ncbi:MAG: hypothetical protein MUE40_17630 [Anaerolineae bacterium]|nr:hypothetical protein [Anaerolineae bacterium]